MKQPLLDLDRELIEAAKKTVERLHVPDRHEVGAALRTSSGRIYTGIHIEAAVGYADVCGEVSAICSAVNNGEHDLDTIVAIRGDGKGSYRILSPCGRCREMIADMNREAWVIVGTFDNPYRVAISELLPLKP
jgi:cytidine deaminase